MLSTPPHDSSPAIVTRIRKPGSPADRIGGLATVAYITFIACVARLTGFEYALFPELGALAHDILKRPHGTWAKAPLMLIVTPFATAVIGTLITRHFAYGFISVFATVGGAILIIRVLSSPIAPAISAGLLPLTLGVTSWWYPPSILFSTGLLALIAVARQRLMPPPEIVETLRDRTDDVMEQAPADYSWIPFFLAFLVLDLALVSITDWRFLLFPPLVVIGFEMFAHTSVCPWAKRSLVLPVACLLNAAIGVVLVSFFGNGPVIAGCSVALGALILRIFDLHAPPVLAVGLLPFTMAAPDYRFALSAGIGTALLTTIFLLWRKLSLQLATH